jgi:hypothetical protein
MGEIPLPDPFGPPYVSITTTARFLTDYRYVSLHPVLTWFVITHLSCWNASYGMQDILLENLNGFITSKASEELVSPDPDPNPLSNQLTLCAELLCVKYCACLL